MAKYDPGKHLYSANPYWNLGAEIIRSAVMANDTRFLRSRWCAELEQFMGLERTGYEIWYKRRYGEWPQSCKK